MKKVLLVSVLLGSLMIGCSNTSTFNIKNDKPSIEELENKIKEQEQYITELEQYKQEKESFERQARQMEKQLEYEEEQANEEKYYIALSDVTVISKNIDDSTSFPFDYGNTFWMTLVDGYVSEFTEYSKPNYYFSVPCTKIESGNTFKLSQKDLDTLVLSEVLSLNCLALSTSSISIYTG